MNANPPSQAETTAKLERVHTQLGFDLFADPGDYLSVLLIRDGVFEAPETDLVTRIVRPGDICIDAGCHLGYYSCLLTQLVGDKGRVYSFDANPQACQSTRRNLALNGLNSAEVIQAALADRNGKVPFYISTDDQTGLSSLGPIPTCKETISVPCLRLEDFLKDRRRERARLLKLDVEGAEEMVLRGLGRFLAAHAIDLILVECFDERLRLLDSSAERVAGILQSANYICWEYGTENPAGWSRTSEVRTRGDCNYLFSSPTVTEAIPSVSLAAALAGAQAQRDQRLSERNELQSQRDLLQGQLDELRGDLALLRQNVEKSDDEVDWLLDATKKHEEELARLRSQKRELEAVWEAVQNSAGWRLLNAWRRARNRIVPDGTRRRKLYDSVMRNFRRPG